MKEAIFIYWGTKNWWCVALYIMKRSWKALCGMVKGWKLPYCIFWGWSMDVKNKINPVHHNLNQASLKKATVTLISKKLKNKKRSIIGLDSQNTLPKIYNLTFNSLKPISISSINFQIKSKKCGKEKNQKTKMRKKKPNSRKKLKNWQRKSIATRWQNKW